MPNQPAIFEDYEIRRIYDEATEIWWFSVVDIIQVLTQQMDYQAARKYWNKLKERLGKEGSESVTNCHRLKLPAALGKQELLSRQSLQGLSPGVFKQCFQVAYSVMPMVLLGIYLLLPE